MVSIRGDQRVDEPQGACLAAGRGLHPAHGAIRGRQHPLRVGEEDRAGGRELDLPRAAPQQRDAERRLERADLLADGLLGDVQLVGCAREVAVLGDGDEVAHLPEVRGHDRAPILWRPRSRIHNRSVSIDNHKRLVIAAAGPTSDAVPSDSTTGVMHGGGD